MKIKSITFDCPILYRGNFEVIEEIRAPELNSFVSGATYNETRSHLVVVDHDNSQYVIDVIKHSYKDNKGYGKHLSQLSRFLQATVSIIKVTLNEDATYSFETVKSSKYDPTKFSVRDEILNEFPKLNLSSSNYPIQEYISYDNEASCCLKLPQYLHSLNHIYLVILPFKNKLYKLIHYTKRSKAERLIDKAGLNGAFVVDVECKLSDSNNIKDENDLQLETDGTPDEFKTLTANDLDSLM